MSEPVSYALSLAIGPETLRRWLAAPSPAPERWTDWADLEIALTPALFDLAARQAGRRIGAILTELAVSNLGGWHFEWRDGGLSLVALQGAVSWREHMMFLCALRAAGDHGGGPGAALAQGYAWPAAGTAWGLTYAPSGETRLAAGLDPAAQAPLDALALPMVAAARAGGSGGPARDELGLWFGG